MANETLSFSMHGSGKPTLLFVHGFACAQGDWSAQVEALSKSFRCVTVDLPGHGGTVLQGQPSMAELATRVNAVRRQLGAAPVVLIGHSLGVRTVIDAYLQQPEDVAGLVLMDGRFYDGDPKEIAQRMAGLVDSAGFDAFVRQAFGGMFTARSDPQLRARVVERAAALDPVYGRTLFLESVLWDSTRGRDALRRIRVPVLSLHSTDIDAQRRMVSLQLGMRTLFMQLLEELVADVSVQIVPDVGHFVMPEAPAVVNAALTAFLARINRSSI